MNYAQPFGYEGVPGTCLWCGRRLPGKGASRRIAVGGDFFDVESCAMQFGATCALNGSRIRPKTADERAREGAKL